MKKIVKLAPYFYPLGSCNNAKLTLIRSTNNINAQDHTKYSMFSFCFHHWLFYLCLTMLGLVGVLYPGTTGRRLRHITLDTTSFF
jgi:hypothetical protein